MQALAGPTPTAHLATSPIHSLVAVAAAAAAVDIVVAAAVVDDARTVAVEHFVEDIVAVGESLAGSGYFVGFVGFGTNFAGIVG